MGHEAFVSDNLLRVPLIVANPRLNGRVLEEYVSIKDLYRLVTAVASGDFDDGTVVDSLVEDGPVFSQYPRLGGREFTDKHPDVPDEILAQRVSEHTVVGYDHGWTVCLATAGNEWCVEDGELVDMAAAPVELRQACEEMLTDLTRAGSGDRDFTDDEIAHLEALGYM